MAHKNSHSNFDPHHLYEIVDKTTGDIFKYGISSELIDENGMSD